MLLYYACILYKVRVDVHCTKTSGVFIRNLQEKKGCMTDPYRVQSTFSYFYYYYRVRANFIMRTLHGGARYPVHEAWPEGVEEHCAFHLHRHTHIHTRIIMPGKKLARYYNILFFILFHSRHTCAFVYIYNIRIKTKCLSYACLHVEIVIYINSIHGGFSSWPRCINVIIYTYIQNVII